MQCIPSPLRKYILIFLYCSSFLPPVSLYLSLFPLSLSLTSRIFFLMVYLLFYSVSRSYILFSPFSHPQLKHTHTHTLSLSHELCLSLSLSLSFSLSLALALCLSLLSLSSQSLSVCLSVYLSPLSLSLLPSLYVTLYAILGVLVTISLYFIILKFLTIFNYLLLFQQARIPSICY